MSESTVARYTPLISTSTKMSKSRGKKRFRELVQKLIKRFKDSPYNLIQRKRDSILAYHAVRIDNVDGYLANPRRCSRWGTLIPQEIAEVLQIPRDSTRGDLLTLPGRRGAISGPRGARFTEVFSPSASLRERSEPPPDDFVRKPQSSYGTAGLQVALSAARSLTEPRENENGDDDDDLYSMLMAHVNTPTDEDEPLLPKSQSSPHPRHLNQNSKTGQWRAAGDSATMFVRDGMRSLLTPITPESTPADFLFDASRTSIPSSMKRKDHISDLRREYSGPDTPQETQHDSNAKEGRPGWM
ncbi:uncharacterized protein RSE6_13216 [Rhynchosporium secalis]|uniref:Uncharacterized protein n=1 Tax=Rhynchosporium secalis TaxID=38038 RepID=A0A1E1MT65_RHYSE|nr:uncharacterized protein RSE6_13216 [Rhynchosporium secalis]